MHRRKRAQPNTGKGMALGGETGIRHGPPRRANAKLPLDAALAGGHRQLLYRLIKQHKPAVHWPLRGHHGLAAQLPAQQLPQQEPPRRQQLSLGKLHQLPALWAAIANRGQVGTAQQRRRRDRG